MKIWAHTLVKNEERFVWYSVTSIVDYVDKILLWDTGSTDNTKKILKLLKAKYPKKIDLKFLKSVSPEGFTQVRQQMLDATEADWLIVSDADEIWWEKSISDLVKSINKNKERVESIFTPAMLLVGDMYHHMEEKAGKYVLKGKRGHFGLKAVNKKIPGLSSLKPHGSWGWVDENKKMIQNRDPKKLLFLNTPFMHASFLQRSENLSADKKVPKRRKKYKIELGRSFPLDYYYPEAFFKLRPRIVKSVWQPMNLDYRIKASFLTPLKMVKRRII